MTEFTTYAQAVDVFATAKNKDNGKPLANNTRLIQCETVDHDGQQMDVLAVRLHKTNVVTYYPDGRIKFDTGGWRTVTTKDRINRFSPINVWQQQHIWYVDAWEIDIEHDGGIHGFKDGMYLDGEGFLVDADPDPSIQKKYAKLAKSYAKQFVRELAAGNVGTPTGGDCWFCATRTKETGRTLHEEYVKHNDFDSILSHIEEPYYVPSLLVRAIERFGVSRGAEQYAWARMQDGGGRPDRSGHCPGGLDPEMENDWMGGVCTDQIQKSIYRYTLSLLGVAA